MGKHSRHYTDLNPLEGGGSGGGSGGRYKSLPQKKQREPDDVALDFITGGVGLASAAGIASNVLGNKMTPEDAEYMANYKKNKREAKNEIKRESRGKEDSMTTGQKQSMQEAKDEEDYQKRKTAPTTKTEMGKAFAKGGMTASSRADGCATKGKTKGRFV